MIEDASVAGIRVIKFAFVQSRVRDRSSTHIVFLIVKRYFVCDVFLCGFLFW